MPILGNLGGVNLADNTTYWQNRTMESEEASVGYFKTVLLNGLAIEITTAQHAGFMRYTFPSSKGHSNTSILSTEAGSYESADNDAHVLIDLTHVLPGYNTFAYSQKFLHGDLHLRSDATGQPSYFGSATYTGGWVQAESYTLFFCGNFSVSNLEPTNRYVTQNGAEAVDGAGTLSWPYNPLLPPKFSSRPFPRSYADVRSYAGNGMGLGALFSWTPVMANASAETTVEAKLGISHISSEQACQSIARELPANKTFEDIQAQVEQQWETKILNKIEIIDDGSELSNNVTLKRMLYTALYQTALMPSDKTGENPYWPTSDASPYYDDMYTLWDIYRTLLPLYHLIYTETYSRFIKGLISIFTNEGFLPAGRSANWNGRVQGGTVADITLADAFRKDRGELVTDIDWEEAYKAVLKDATVMPVRNQDVVAFDGATKEGRGALDDYLRLGFITRNHTRSMSRGVEYAHNDYAIYAFGELLSKTSAHVSSDQLAEFRKRADWWQNQWSAEANVSLSVPSISNSTSNTTFTGFPAPRNSDGSWNYTAYNPLSCGGCGWGDDIYEAKVWETAFSAAPHDMSKLIELMGGDEEFVKRLDVSFLPGFGTSVGANNDAGSALFNPGNEPSFTTPFLYNYVPKNQWKTANQSRATVDSFYSDARDGYPGNIDGGALPSWLIWNLIGLYPIPTQPLYLLVAPRFPSLRISLFSSTPLSKTLTIRAQNLSDINTFPQEVTFNGESWNRSWISHEELSHGGELVFVMGDSPGEWDVGERPASFSGW
ncbi:glycoside hydrolase family 92 protein, partial [Periconia macrospinosa]